FVIGNAAGEAHPAIAEGIGMAMRSAAILCRSLLERPSAIASPRIAHEVSVAYERQWRSDFGLRIAASELFAQVAMRPRVVRSSELLLRCVPGLLSFCARVSGKTRSAC